MICALLSRKGRTDYSVNSDFLLVFRCLFLPVAFDLMRSGHMTGGLRAGWFPVSASNRVILRLPANSHRADLKGRMWLYVFLMLREGESGGSLIE